ncbi:MAG: alpha-amlyase [Bacteroidetes bacterium]|nr:MAG: alpha-amlyase [Bacteroidota bacterium]
MNLFKSRVSLFLLFIFLVSACTNKNKTEQNMNTKQVPFIWESANVYFMLIDRFNNGKLDNDVNFDRTKETGKLRGFMGGDIKGITKKIKDGYFNDLGINALWLSPVFEQIHDAVDEGTGNTYGFHGYWTKDWTSLEPNFGTEEDLEELVETAHQHGIRVLLDVVINHTGPVTEKDPVWPESWVRTGPQCTYDGYNTTIECTLVKNLPDIKTENNETVELPKQLIEKWKKEGRYEEELKELNEFFEATGYKKTPQNYIIKWLVDLIKKYGIDGYRVDTVKHTEESVWDKLYKVAAKIFKDWKEANPEKVLDDNDFFMVGEVYGYGISGKQIYNFGDKEVNYFENGFNSLINFEFKVDATKGYEEIFTKYSNILNSDLKGKSVLNYVSSHDDGGPFDKNREKPFESATKLLLSPGASQVYYGDETARSLVIEGTVGDATLRSFMNWEELEQNAQRNGFAIKDVLAHWQKLGQFRKEHPSIGAGIHEMISEKPYYFKRTFESGDFKDVVFVGLDLEKGLKEIDVQQIYADGTVLKDYYSNQFMEVKNGKISLESEFDIVLLADYQEE